MSAPSPDPIVAEPHNVRAAIPGEIRDESERMRNPTLPIVTHFHVFPGEAMRTCARHGLLPHTSQAPHRGQSERLRLPIVVLHCPMLALCEGVERAWRG